VAPASRRRFPATTGANRRRDAGTTGKEPKPARCWDERTSGNGGAIGGSPADGLPHRAILVSKSTDGGTTWSNPTAVADTTDAGLSVSRT